MITYKEAQHIIRTHARAWGNEVVALEESFGRIMTETIRADRDYPPFNRAAMDGYAFHYQDFEQGVRRFTIVETLFAGQIAVATINSGQCYKIMTGAAVPPGANVVIRREDTTEQDALVTLLTETCTPFQNIAKQGEDVAGGAVIIDHAVVITPAVISLLATIGKQSVHVSRKPRIAIITTGNEVIPVDGDVTAVQIRNSNAWLLKALLRRQSLDAFAVVHVPDDPGQLHDAFAKVLEADLVISCGAVSAGDADYVPGVLQSLGVQKLFHKTAIKPGKPAWCGQMPAGGLWFALPGNPFSCMVTFTLFVKPYLCACYGLDQPLWMQLTLQGERCKKSSLDEFFPVGIVAGSGKVKPLPVNGSGDVQAALFADGLAIHPHTTACLNNNDIVDYLPL
jgi:molybdopterin molybdotransferase